MKRILWISALLAGGVLATLPFEAKGAEGVVLNERVNVRARPSLASEVICQLNTGSRVQILGHIRSENQPGEPKEWYRIQAPSPATRWVSSQYIDPNTQAVTASRLNVRVGRGTNFSVVGRLERNTIVKPIRSLAGWTAIQPLPGTTAYLAAEFVDLVPEKEIESSAPENPSGQAPPIVSDEEIPEIIIDDPKETEPGQQTESGTKTPPAPGGQTLPPPIYNPEESSLKDSESPEPDPNSATADQSPAEKPGLSLSEEAVNRLKRIITRDGIVRRARNIQAPTYHRLEDPRTGTTINYLHTGELKVSLGVGPDALKSYEGRKIRVIGEEAVDTRWPGIPVIEIEELRVLE